MGGLVDLLLRRVLTGFLTLLLVVSFMFFFMRLAGDPIIALVGEDAPAAVREAAMAQRGFDRPLIVQYGDYLAGVVRGDFGDSFRYNEPAMGLVVERMPATMALAGVAMLVGIMIAIPIGIYSALKPGSWIDSASRVFAVLGQSVPAFWLGILLIIVFAVNFNVLPSGGSGTWRHLLLPSAALAVYSVPLTMRLVRSSMLDVLSQEYVRMARAKGLANRIVIVRHAFRNALIPVITVIALQAGNLLTGAIVLEEVFAYPGLGRLAIGSMRLSDYAVIQAFVFVAASILIVINLIVDILYGLVDPRVRVS